MNWAERNYGKPDAVPPNALAGRLLELARERPDLFVRCLALRDAPKREARPPKTPAPAIGTVAVRREEFGHACYSDVWHCIPGGLMSLVVNHCDLARLLEGGEMALTGMPPNFHIVAGYIDGRGLVLLIHSDGLPHLKRGEPIPEKQAMFQSLGMSVQGRRI